MAFNRIRGRHGNVSIPSLGAVVGKFDGEGGWWEIIRKKDEETDPNERREEGQQGKPVVYIFRAVLSYVQHDLWNAMKPDGSPRYTKELTIKVGQSLYRVEAQQQMVLSGRTLQCEEVTLAWLE